MCNMKVGFGSAHDKTGLGEMRVLCKALLFMN